MTDITMPKLSDSMEEGTILSWLKADGDQVAEGDELLEIETDKATMTYQSPTAGTLMILAAEGSAMPVGTPIARVGARDGAPAPTEAGTEPALSTSPVQHAAPTREPVGYLTAPVRQRPPSLDADGHDGAITATPVARRLARVHEVSLAALTGSGPRGRITRIDVATAAGLAASPAPAQVRRDITPLAAAPASAGARAHAPGTDAGSASRGVVVRDLTRLQKVVARRMAEAKTTVPEFQVQTEVAMDAAIALRSRLKEVGTNRVPSINDLIVKASALALREHPLANASYKDGHFELHPRVNVGVAVAAQDALMVPTITDADTRSLGSIAVEGRRLAERVRAGTITPPELSGATFTVSNLGMYGMTAITPVINLPQAAILGVGATRAVLAREAKEIVERQLMTLTLTCDHRILYGADAASFLAAIRGLLEQPLRLAM